MQHFVAFVMLNTAASEACSVQHGGIVQPKLAAFWTFWILGLAGVLVCCNGAQCKFMLCFGPRRERM